MQRAEAGAAAGRRRPAEHDEFLAPAALHLQPVAAAPGAIGRIGPLADDALEPGGAGVRGASRPRRRFEVVAVAQPSLPVSRRPQRRLAVEQRGRGAGPSRSGAAGRRRRRELLVAHRRRAPPAGRGSSTCRPASSATSSPSSSAVSTPSAPTSARDGGEARGPVMQVARDEPRAAVLDEGEQAVAVELDLADPLGARRRFLRHARELRRLVLRQASALRARRRARPARSAFAPGRRSLGTAASSAAASAPARSNSSWPLMRNQASCRAPWRAA